MQSHSLRAYFLTSGCNAALRNVIAAARG